MASITSSQYLDSGTARTAGEVHAISNNAVLTIRTDTRLHANAPASYVGSLGSPTFTGLGGELLIDATAVRELAYTGGSGNVPAIGTLVTQGGVSGYLLGVWNNTAGPAINIGAAMPASGKLKLREVTGGTFAVGALTGIAATASGPDVVGWIEVVWDDAVNFVVGRVGKIKTRGAWYELGTTNGSVGQQFVVPTTSSASTNNFCPGAFVESFPGSGFYEFYAGLSSAANMWIKTSIGHGVAAATSTDKRTKFVKTFGSGIVQFGESVTTAATYASLAAQAGTYTQTAIGCNYYCLENDTIRVYTNGAPHYCDEGQSVGLVFLTNTVGTAKTSLITSISSVDDYYFEFSYPGALVGDQGTLSLRPGLVITFTAHGLNEREATYCDFTSGGGADGTYLVYSIDGVNGYRVEYPSLSTIASGNVSCLHTLTVTLASHGHSIGNTVYCSFTSGTGVNGSYIIKLAPAGTFNINWPHSATTSGNVTLSWILGHVPASGCKVRIPNILWSSALTASRATNAVPNATIASRPEFNTSTAGAIDMENIYCLNGRWIFSQPYSISLKNCALQETLDISECATPVVIENVGVGSYSAQDARTLQLTSNSAGGTITNFWGHRPTIGAYDHAVDFSYCKGFTVTNLEAGIIGYARSSGYPITLNVCKSITLNNCKVFNGPVSILTSSGIVINNLDYSDRYIGKTNTTTPCYAIVSSTGCDGIVIDGFTSGLNGTIHSVHPFNGILNPSSCSNIKLRNVGSAIAPYQLTENIWAVNQCGMTVVMGSSGNNSRMKFQKIFVNKLRGQLVSQVNSDRDVLFENMSSRSIYTHSTKSFAAVPVATLVATVRNITDPMQSQPTGQTSIYGSHWKVVYHGATNGTIVLLLNEPTVETATEVTFNSGTPKFDSAGGLAMYALGTQVEFVTPYWIKGVTSLGNLGAKEAWMTGGTLTNYTREFAVDTGSGFSGWLALTSINLKTFTNLSSGFKLKIRLTTSVANTTNITFLRIPFSTTRVAQIQDLYPLDTINTTITANVSLVGAEVRVYKAADMPGDTAEMGVELAGVESAVSSTFTVSTLANQNIWIQIMKEGYFEYTLFYTTGSVDTTLPIVLIADTTI